MNAINWSDFTGGLTPRAQQIECLDRLAASQADVLLVQAPTGAGKSLIMAAFCRYARALQPRNLAYIVTPQRALQVQLAQGVPDLRVMMGASNYRCAHYAAYPESHRRHRGCPYFAALDAAIGAPIVVHNYGSFLHQRAAHFPRRALMCLDEGHRGAEALGLFLELEVTPEMERYLCAGPLLPQLQEMAVARASTPLPELNRMLRHMRSHWWLYGLPEPCADAEDAEPWMESQDARDPIDLRFEEDAGRIVPTLLSGAGHLLSNGGDRLLVFSATVLDPAKLLGELGLRGRTYEYVDLPSTFSPERRPIVTRYCGKMSQKYQAQTLPRLLGSLKADAERHCDEAGIVHTVSYSLAQAVATALDGPRVVRLQAGRDRDRMIADFLAGSLGPNRILVGPGLHEGLDGAGDAVRWQAIVKSPAPFMGDTRVQAIFRRNDAAARDWYAWKTAQTLVQMIGRVCRSEDDYGVTYIYDSSAESTLRGKFCPRYVREAIK